MKFVDQDLVAYKGPCWGGGAGEGSGFANSLFFYLHLKLFLGFGVPYGHSLDMERMILISF